MSRVLLVTGLPGAGRTTVAAATAVAAASAGRRTLLLGADGTPDTAVVLGPWDGAAPVPGLTVSRVDVRAGFEQGLLHVQGRLTGALAVAGVEPLDPEEITTVAGAGDVLALRTLALEAASGRYDLIVADLPPADRAVPALALPEGLMRYLDRLLPVERQAARALRPVLAALVGVPMPEEWIYETARRAGGELAALRKVVEAPTTSVRLVLRPGTTALAAARRAASALALHRHAVEDVVVNHMSPPDSPDPVVRERAEAARDTLDALCALFPGTPLTQIPALWPEPIGPDDLYALSGHLGPLAPTAPRGTAPAVERDGERLVLVLPLPGVDRRDLDLLRRGDELIVTAGDHRRLLPLPSALRRCTIEGASLRDGRLRVRFAPDPAVWMRGT